MLVCDSHNILRSHIVCGCYMPGVSNNILNSSDVLGCFFKHTYILFIMHKDWVLYMFIRYTICIIYFYMILYILQYLLFEYAWWKTKELYLKVKSSNPTYATWCVTLIKWLYHFVLKMFLWYSGVVLILKTYLFHGLWFSV